MTEHSKPAPASPSFSTARRWKIGLDTVLRSLLVLAVVIMANCIAYIFSREFYLSPRTRIHLSPRTESILQTLTNHVEVTVYCHKEDFGMYSTVMGLLREYQRLDPRLNVQVVDYDRDPAAALQVQEKYHLQSQLGNASGPPQKNLIIFDCDGRHKIGLGKDLVQYAPVGLTKDKQLDMRPYAFFGEKMFTSMLLGVTRDKPFTAYFAQGDGEPALTNPNDTTGFFKFADILHENYVNVLPYRLAGDEDIPADCDLLVIAGPRLLFSDSEFGKLDHYLSQGGRLLVLMDYDFVRYPTSLEEYLAHWGVNVGMNIVVDPNSSVGSLAIVVQDFSAHPVVNSLAQSKMELFYARPVSPMKNSNVSVSSPTVTVLAQSGPDCQLAQLSSGGMLYEQRGFTPQSFPLMVAVEQNSVKGIASQNGGMRMVVVGDSQFLDNQMVDIGGNSDFAANAVNWLLDRPLLLNGIGPSPVTDFRLVMTQSQVWDVRWLLLAALPGGVLAFGGLVWLRRRK